MKTLITICARGGSKGVPGKNIKIVNGLPLIAYSIKHAKFLSEEYNSDIGLSTDSEEIKDVAFKYGIKTSYVRESKLATDDIGKLDVIKALLEYEEKNKSKKYDFIIDLDVTSPLRTINDLRTAYNMLKDDRKALNIFSVNNARKNPYFNMVEKKENGYYNLVKEAGTILSRQNAPNVYELNASFYIYKRKFFDLGFKTVLTDYSLIFKMDHICFDIDEVEDMIYMEYLLKNNLLDFELW